MADRFLGVSAVVVFIWFSAYVLVYLCFCCHILEIAFPFLLMLDCIAT